VKQLKQLNDIALVNKSSQRYVGRHLLYGITQCYLPPVRTELAPPGVRRGEFSYVDYLINLTRRDRRLS